MDHKFIDATLKFEGGWGCVPGDKGGETYRGIARVANPQWEGWSVVDAAKPLHYNQIIANPKLDQMVYTFYINTFFTKLHLDLLTPDIGGYIFDWAVNVGGFYPVKHLQQCVNELSNAKLTVDGQMGPHTASAANACDQVKLHAALVADRCEYYQNIVKNDSNQAKFLNGWLTRAKNYPNI